MKMKVKVKCPYCGNDENYVEVIEPVYGQKNIITCDAINSQGCRKDFAVYVEFKLEITTKKMVD